MELTCLVCRTVGLTVVWVTMALSCIISEKIAMNSTLPLGGSRRNTAVRFATVKQNDVSTDGENVWGYDYSFLTQYMNVPDNRTDGRTDGQTDRHRTTADMRPLCISRGKNNKKLSCRRETALRLVSLSILPSHPRSLTVIWNNTVE